MKHQETFRQRIKARYSFAVAGIVLAIAGLFAFTHVFAAANDPKFYHFTPTTTGVVQVGTKQIPTATVSIRATSSNGTLYNVPGSSKVYLVIHAISKNDTRRHVLGSNGGGSVTFTDLYPATRYTVDVVMSELQVYGGFQDRSLESTLIDFTTPAGDSPVSAYSTFTQAKTPVFFNNDKSVRLYLRSSHSYDNYQLSLRSAAGDYFVSKSNNIIHAYQSEADVKEVVFDNLLPGVVYTPTVSMVLPDATLPAKIMDLAGFTSPGTPPPPAPKQYIYTLQGNPVVSVVAGRTASGPKNVTVTLKIISPTSQSGISVVAMPAVGGGSGPSPVDFVANVPKTVTINNLMANTLYDITVYKFKEKNSNTVMLGQFRTPSNTDLMNPTEVALIVPKANTSGGGTGITSVPSPATPATPTTCTDGIDNDGDGKTDFYGTAASEPDPSCLTAQSEELPDDVKSSIIPCTDKCSFSDVFKLLNNILNFILTQLLAPLFVVMIMYMGYQYLAARGNPGMHAKLKTMLVRMVGGLVLILCAWLIVRTIMSTLGYTDGLQFFD